MELKSFREILLKKAEGNPYLQTLIKYAKDDLIADEVVDFLLKMAEPSAAMGRGANSALTHFAGQMGTSDVEQMRDALGHHISHYRGALKGMHAAQDPQQKSKLRHIADQHLNKIVPLMHVAGRVGKHSGGKMTLDYVGTTPWESNYTTTHRHEHNGKLKEGTKDLGRRIAPNASREKNIRAVPDYRYLEMPPHPGHGMSNKMPHKGGYPFEEVQLGAPAKRDVGQAYLPIEDVSPTEFVPHPYDQHPIHAIADTPEHHLTPEEKEKFKNDVSTWKQSEHHKKWLADHKIKFQADPEAYKNRGLAKPGHVYEGVPLQSHPEHVKASSAPAESTTSAVVTPNKEVSKPQESYASTKPSIENKATAYDISKPPKEGLPKAITDNWNSFSEKVRRSLLAELSRKK